MIGYIVEMEIGNKERKWGFYILLGVVERGKFSIALRGGTGEKLGLGIGGDKVVV